MDESLKKWRQEGNHLPDFLKDFHRQKDFFKLMHESLQPFEDSPTKSIDTMAGHIYTLDHFLHFCARFGYTLQKSRAHQNFEDLSQTIQQANEQRAKKFHDLLTSGDKNNNS